MTPKKRLGYLIPIHGTIGKPIPIIASIALPQMCNRIGRTLYTFSITSNILVKYGAINIDEMIRLQISMDSGKNNRIRIGSITLNKELANEKDLVDSDIIVLSEIHIYRYERINYNSLSYSSIMPYDNCDNICPVCLESLGLLRQTVQTQCRHVFCLDCIRRIMMNESKCPLCRSIINNLNAVHLNKCDEMFSFVVALYNKCDEGVTFVVIYWFISSIILAVVWFLGY
eukprot:541091_1